MDSRSRAVATSTDPRVQGALQDYFARLDRGELIDVEALVAAHPDVAVELRSFIAFDAEARRLAGGAPGGPPAPQPAPARPKAELTTHPVAGPIDRTASGRSKPAAESSATPSVPRSPDDLPELFGRYRVQKKLGAGAMGAVYLAEDTLLQRRVALKIPTFDDDPEGELLRRFHREARAVANLKHHNLCAVYDVGEIDGRHYISMEFVAGRKLQDFIKPDKPLAEKQAIAVVRKIALGMQEAHAHGVIHRDLKPDNIMVSEKGEPVVMDFGLVHKLESRNSTRLTQKGTLVGSPAYMSKEQVEGDPDKLTGATDQYSLGVILYQLLTSRLPFEGGLHSVLGAILTKEPPPLREFRSDINPHLEAVCLKMMAKAAEDRYPSMKAAADALVEVAKGTSRAAGAVAVPSTPPESLTAGLVGTLSGDVTAPNLGTSSPFDFGALPSLSSTPPVRRSPSQRPKLLLYGGLAAGLAVLLGVVIWIRSGDALVRVEVLSDDVTATFAKETLTLDDGAHEFKVTVGEHRLHIETDGIKFDTDKFTLKRGENPVVTVERTASEVVAKFDDKPIGRRLRQTPSSRQTPVNPASNPDELPVGKSIDLLSMVTLPEHAIAGSWRKVNGEILGEPFAQQRFVVPVAITGSYKLTCQVTRREGGGDISPVLQVGDSDCSVAYMDSVCGLDLVDGLRPGGLVNTSAAIERSSPLINGVSYKLEVSVSVQGRDATIEAFLDGERLISWTGATKRLSRDWSHSLPRGYSIGLHSYASAITVHSMQLEIQRGSRGVRLAAAPPDAAPQNADSRMQATGATTEAVATTGTLPLGAPEGKELSAGVRPLLPGGGAAADAAFAGTNPGERRELTDGKIPFRWCPRGSFMMGSPASEEGREPDEDQVRVTLSRGFWMKETEVTQGEWETLMGTTPWKGKDDVKEGANYAATYVSHSGEADSADSYCAKLTVRERAAGRLPAEWEYRLPTEAEWEYACRAATPNAASVAYSFGNDAAMLNDHAWYGRNANDMGEKYAHPVGRKKANTWGLRDMHGNVWEWCQDVYVDKLPGGTDPLVSVAGTTRLNRGGSWNYAPANCRSADRGKDSPRSRLHNLGFRPLAIDTTATKTATRTTDVPTLPDGSVANNTMFSGKNAGERRELTNKSIPFRWCPAGSFLMGSPASEAERQPDEDLVRVTLSRGFWLQETEVTQGEWQGLMGTTPWKGKELVKEGASCAATYIAHSGDADSAESYCARLTTREHAAGRLPAGWVYRLPTEAEWEYACRAGTTTRFSFGDDAALLSDFGWWGGRIPGNGNSRAEQYAHEVGLKQPNPWGLRDIYGNVQEWCQDVYLEKLAGGADPSAKTGGAYRVCRSSWWGGGAARSADRHMHFPHARGSDLGFRPVAIDTAAQSITVKPADGPPPASVPPVSSSAPVSFAGMEAGERRVMTSAKSAFRWCPAGTFVMGQADVTLSRGFWMQETEVTQREWQSLMESTPWKNKRRYEEEGADYPATYVSHSVETTSAGAYCQKLTLQEHLAGSLPKEWEYRLPTEAEWEYACRAGTSTMFFFGSEGSMIGEYAWCGGQSAFASLHAVGQKQPNPWGLRDMYGNVAEWCEDAYAQKLPGGTDPIVAGGGYRVNRGGSIHTHPNFCGSANRTRSMTSTRNSELGFRPIAVPSR